MSTVASTMSVFTNREFPFDKIETSQLEKRNRKYFIDYTIEDTPIFLQINRVKLISDIIFVDEDQAYIEVEVTERKEEIKNYFRELDNFNQVLCFKSSEDWLGKKLPMSEIEKVYKNSLRDNQLRLKIEKNAIRIYDMQKNKLNIETDIKVGNYLDVIIEIGGLKVLKNSFSTHLLLRQIRKHRDVEPKKKQIPNEYLFLDEYSVRRIGVDGEGESDEDGNFEYNLRLVNKKIDFEIIVKEKTNEPNVFICDVRKVYKEKTKQKKWVTKRSEPEKDVKIKFLDSSGYKSEKVEKK